MEHKVKSFSNKDHHSFISGKCKSKYIFQLIIYKYSSFFFNIGLMLKLRRMVHIEVYTGSRRSQSKKMAVLKVKCGKKLLDILVIGEITARKALVSNSIKTEINMKVCGLWIRNMVRVLTGVMKLESLEESILEIGSKTKSMEEEPSSLRIVIDMMDIG